jgi:ABC-type antimicrobial peptide transport system permease subunit
LRRSRELGIRIAIGARPWDVARTVMTNTILALTCGAAAGITVGLLSVRYVEGLLFEVKGTDLRMLMLPSVIILAASLLAALPAVVRAIRVDPLTILRAE